MKKQILSVFLSFLINLVISTVLLLIAFQWLRYKNGAYEITWDTALLYCLGLLGCSYLLFFLLRATSTIIKNNKSIKIVVALVCGVTPPAILKGITFGIDLTNSFEAAEFTIFALTGVLIPIVTSAIYSLVAD